MVAGAEAPGRLELLAPAGEPRALRAALAAGADAVYFGLERWSARAFAGNFAGEAAREAVELAHLYDARAYVALNTLLKDDEVEPALAALEAPYLAGLDALIIADLGLLLRVRERYPELRLHASTQLNAHSSSQLAALAELGCRRAVLARELSLAEIEALDTHGLELEAFVHGALCYGYSGNCLLSSMIGGRSGNRGRCSQSCRLRYDLRLAQSPGSAVDVADDTGADAATGASASSSRVMSTSDLAAIGSLPQLIAAGVTSFKIEGRMKDPAYVAVTTAVYREALDAALADPGGYVVRPEWLSRLEQSFSRSFTAAHLEGRHHEVRSGGRAGHRGVLVGRVAAVDEASGAVTVRLSRPVTTGDVVSFYTQWGQTEPMRLEEGGDDQVVVRLRERVSVKDRLFRLAAAQADELAQDLITGRAVLRPIRLHMVLEGGEGQPAKLCVVAAGATEPIVVTSTAPLVPARTAALTFDKARDALGALGGTPYRLADLDLKLVEGLFMPVGELKDLRRRALAALDERRLAAGRRSPQAAVRGSLQTPVAPPVARPVAPPPEKPAGLPDRLDVILRVRPGEEPLAAPGVTGLCLDLVSDDPLAIVTYAADRLRSTGLPVRVRLPEVLFDGDEAWWRMVVTLPWQGVHARHLGVMRRLAEASDRGVAPFILEYPVQGLNDGAVRAALSFGRPPLAVLVSPEASLAEIAALDVMPARLEVLAFGRQQLLHTRDQLGRTEGLYDVLEPGEHVGLLLTDAKGYEFPAKAAATGTRLFNARVTNLAGNLDELAEAGVGGFHVTQADLDAEERDVLLRDGLRGLAALASRERSTTGHLFRGVA